MAIEDEELDLSMTLIIGIETKSGLIIASDGLAGVTLTPLEIPDDSITDQTKVFAVSPYIVIGVCGGMINRLNQLISDISTSIRKKEPSCLIALSKAIDGYVPQLYADRINHPSFGISFFIAGYAKDEKGYDDGKLMFMLHEHNTYTYEPSQPWICVGNNERAYEYMKRHASQNMTNAKATQVSKDAIHDTTKTEDDVGGHTFVYRLDKKGFVRIE